MLVRSLGCPAHAACCCPYRVPHAAVLPSVLNCPPYHPNFPRWGCLRCHAQSALNPSIWAVLRWAFKALMALAVVAGAAGVVVMALMALGV